MPINNTKIKIKNTKEATEIFMPEMRYLNIEVLKVVVLDTKNHIKYIKDFTTNNSNMVNLDITDVIKEAIKYDASRLILLHNHPSGDSTPSIQDINFTIDLKDELKKFKVELLDHIVIGDGNYSSIMKYI